MTMRTVASFVLVVLGFVVAFWGGFCLLGGPDGRILSSDSFIFGGGILFIAGLLITVSRIFVRTGLFIYTPMFVCGFAWTVAITMSQYDGFYAWLYCVPASAIASIAYWFVRGK